MCKWVIGLTSISCFGSFVWAVKKHFRSDRVIRPGMQAVSFVSLAAIGWFLFRLQGDDVVWFWPLPLTMMFVSLILFWWAVSETRVQRLTLAFDEDVPEFIYQTGPYRYVGHPFYNSYFLFWISTCLVTPGLFQWIVPLALGTAYLTAARREERKFAASPVAATYQRYRESRVSLVFLLWRRLAG